MEVIEGMEIKHDRGGSKNGEGSDRYFDGNGNDSDRHPLSLEQLFTRTSLAWMVLRTNAPDRALGLCDTIVASKTKGSSLWQRWRWFAVGSIFPS